MTSINENGSVVWSKGDACMSPYSGDNELYKGVIQRFRRSPAGDVMAVIKFDGYGDDDIEEVKVDKLQKVKDIEKVKGPVAKRKSRHSPVSEGMFSPLQGSELSQRLKAKYETQSDEDDEISSKSEKLSSLLFVKKSPGPCVKESGNKPSKGVVAVGGKAAKGRDSSIKAIQEKKRSGESPETSSPFQRKCQLSVTGGQAKDPQKELSTSKKVSDISSILDSVKVKRALQKHADMAHYGSDDEDSSNSGFNEEDMEKPKFTFKAEGAKVPLLLSEEDETPVVQVPGTLNQYLRDYQREGIKFLYSHYKNNRGAILGDDMGLGKTVQVIGFLSALLGKQGNRVDVMRQKPRFIRKLSDSASVRTDAPSRGPFLIIGPGCVLYNWIEEFQTWGYFSVRKYHGTDKADCMREIRKGKVEIVITTFETFREHMEDLNNVDWDAVIVDEVHKIKDMKARTTKALREINTWRRYGLTGTALQNNLLEFWSILDWARPGCLGSQADYASEFVRPIEVGQRHDANKRELATARKQKKCMSVIPEMIVDVKCHWNCLCIPHITVYPGKEKLAEIRKTMMVRRVKSLIADQLPKKDDSVVFCKLSQLQMSIYQTILDQPGMDYVLHGDDPCGCDSGEPQSKCCKKKTPDGQSIRSLRFTFMHLLLKTANHVALLIPRKKTSDMQADAARKICEIALSKHPEFLAQTKEASFKTLSDPKYCGKMKVLQGLLKVFYKDHSKVLVFSYSTQVLDIIEQHLMSTGYEYRRIDGAVSSKKRLIIVREFNTDPNIFICLISTKAGGLGLNLTGANKVVIFDPNWNPTHDLQAQDRAYRIGQRRDVQVYRLISTGTIEENMYLRQIYKQQLLNVTVEDENARRYFYAVQGNPRQKGEIFGVRNMFILRTGESCITRDIIKRNERVESALEGFDVAQYVPPVVRMEEDDDYDSQVVGGNSTSGESEDPFAEFFSTDESDVEQKEVECNIVDEFDSSDMEEGNSENKGKISKKGGNCNTTDKNKHSVSTSEDDKDSKTIANLKDVICEKSQNFNSREKPKVRFQDPPRGKVKPSESRTGKGPLKRIRKQNSASGDDADADDGSNGDVVQYDQTLAGTFADVSDVFDNCGVVHIHKNVKVVGGSRAEDHMSRCAIADVYELHQHSQDLAAQCEPMSESSEEESPEPVKKRRGRVNHVEDHNSVRSTVIGNTNVLIGQTPKAFRVKYFEELANQQNAESLLEFAELVLGLSVEDRIKMLNAFYKSREPALKDIHMLKTSKSGTEVVKSYSKRKYEKAKAKSSQKVTPSSSRVRCKVGQEMSFLDDVELDSESVSQQNNKSEQIRSGGESAESIMEVGRKVTPRKRGQKSPNRKLMKKSRVENKPVHKPVTATFFEDGGNAVEEDNKKMNTEEGVESEDLLEEIGKCSEEDEEHMRDNKSIKQNKNLRKNLPAFSILDDIFGSVENEANQTKKPPPSKNLIKNSPTKKVGSVRREREKVFVHADNDPFKAIDEIFGGKNDTQKSSNAEERKRKDLRNKNAFKANDNDYLDVENDVEVSLEDSTLKDDHFDCFDDPKLWKKRKRKEPDKRNIVDRLIADSDADFNDLFTSGKLKKKASKSDEVTGRQNSESLFDGSASLFG